MACRSTARRRAAADVLLPKEGCLRELPAAAGVLSLPPRKAAQERAARLPITAKRAAQERAARDSPQNASYYLVSITLAPASHTPALNVCHTRLVSCTVKA